MNKPPKKKISELFSSRADGLWMILLPLAAIGCCLLLLVPQLSALTEYARESAGNSALPETRLVVLTAESSERDMTVAVRDENNCVLTGERFYITLTYPTGDSADFVTKTDGSCYIVELDPGEYTVSMSDTAVGVSAEPIQCTVREKAEYAVSLTEAADSEKSTGVWKKENGHTFYYDADGQRAVGLKRIGGRLYYFNARGEKARSLGIDVSCFNGNINWRAVKEQGIDFAVIRVGGRGWFSGIVYEDTFLQKNLAGAGSVGIKTGVYFYSTAVSTAEAMQEAGFVIEKLKGAHLALPVFIDMELSGSYPRGRADTLSTAARVDIANAFCRTVIHSGYAAGVYTGQYYMNSCMDYRSVSQYPYWLANYTADNAMPGFPGRYDIWQFTDAGQMAGIPGMVDLNVIF